MPTSQATAKTLSLTKKKDLRGTSKNLEWVVAKKIDLDIYLAEVVVEDEGSFDILRWWKLNSKRFLILVIWLGIFL